MHLWNADASDLVGLVKAGDVSAVEVVTSHLERIAESDGEIHAWELVDEEGALAQAREVDRRIRIRGDVGSLAGLPIGVKDVIDVCGLPTGAGFDPYRKDRFPLEDATCVAALRRAGAVIVGKTVTVQFALGQDDPGTRNPRDPRRTAGGSSSGSAAAVAAQQVPLTLGTQTTGSLLRPAGYCGVVGFKPSFGWVDNEGVLPTSWGSDHVGLITRTVADASLAYDAIVAHDRTRPAARRRQLDPPRLGVVRELVEASSPAVRKSVEESIRRLHDAGAELVDCALPAPLELLLAVHWIGVLSDGAATHLHQFEELQQYYGPLLRANLEAGSLIPASTYVHAARVRSRLRGKMAELVGTYDALVAPTAPDRAPIMDPESRTGLGDPSYQAPWSCFGLPNLCLPLPDESGLADSVQFVTSWSDERRLLDLARWCETVVGGR